MRPHIFHVLTDRTTIAEIMIFFYEIVEGLFIVWAISDIDDIDRLEC